MFAMDDRRRKSAGNNILYNVINRKPPWPPQKKRVSVQTLWLCYDDLGITAAVADGLSAEAAAPLFCCAIMQIVVRAPRPSTTVMMETKSHLADGDRSAP